MCALSFECGIDTVSWCAEFALRRRVSMSATGSVIVMVVELFLAVVSAREPDLRALVLLPAALGDAGQFARVRHLAEADAAQAELAVDRVRPAAALAPGVAANRKLRLAAALFFRAVFAMVTFSLNGKPSCLSSARPSSSFFAVVTTVMSMPRTRSILSWSISWNIDCSVRPNV